jgi:hypothetical protein
MQTYVNLHGNNMAKRCMTEYFVWKNLYETKSSTPNITKMKISKVIIQSR